MSDDPDVVGRSAIVPDITVVVPTRNRAELVARLLRQLAAIDDDLLYEVIVIDEASSDSTPAVLAHFVEVHGFRVIRHDAPVGLSAARNVGLANARGRHIGWIDDDDLTSRDRLRRQHEALVRTGARWSCAGRIDIDDSLTPIGHFRCPVIDDFKRDILRSNILPTAAQGLLVDRQLAIELGGYDESLRSAEDWEFAIRIGQIADPHLLDEPLVAYRTGVESMSTNTATMEAAITAVVAKHADLYTSLGVEPDWAAIHSSLLAADLLASRSRALRRAVAAARARLTVRALRRIVLIAVAPRWFAERSARRRAQQIPPDWLAHSRAWLAEVRQQT